MTDENKNAQESAVVEDASIAAARRQHEAALEALRQASYASAEEAEAALQQFLRMLDEALDRAQAAGLLTKLSLILGVAAITSRDGEDPNGHPALISSTMCRSAYIGPPTTVDVPSAILNSINKRVWQVLETSEAAAAATPETVQ